MKAWHMILLIAIVAVIASVVVLSFNTEKGSLPRYASVHPLIRDAYTFAYGNQDKLDGVNCYCGCMQRPHNGRIHRRGLLDCFMNMDGDFDRHASECDMCINDALEAKKLGEEGKTKNEIKMYIDSKYTR
ncbi:hypothetical protein HYZ41_00480 [archaeon]|nr:hypothetical protein [archaeon]